MTSKQVKARQEVRRLALRWGCEIDTTDGEVNICAPNGKMWACDPGVHELVNSPGGNDTQADMWLEALDRVSAGLIDCLDGDDCEWCHEVIA